jgi:CheY-like chemotaxis protein
MCRISQRGLGISSTRPESYDMEARSNATNRGTRKLKILVADDDSVNRKFLAALFTSHGHIVRQCQDGVAALACLKSEPCDAVISDLAMPRMDAYPSVTRSAAARA